MKSLDIYERMCNTARMKNYTVSYPIAGTVTIFVEAEDEQDAIEVGWDLIDDVEAELQWEPMTHISRGNVLFAPSNNIEVTESY